MTEIGFTQNGAGWSYQQMRDFWVEADRLGFDSGSVMDNSVYPWVDGEMLEIFEAWTILPALAEATERIRLGPLVTPCGRRHPALLAKITTTFDRISNGRLNLALGTSDERIFFEPWGMRFPKFPERVKILREEIEILKRMWTESAVDFRGEYYTLTQATNDPKPIQTPHPPIWLGTEWGSPTVVKLAAEVADGLNVLLASDEGVKSILESLDKACKEVGTAFDTLTRSRSLNVVFTNENGELDVDDRGGTTPGVFGKRFRELVGTREDLASYTTMPLAESRRRRKAAGMGNDHQKKSFHEMTRLGHRFVIGTPDEIAAELRRIAGFGFNLLNVRGLDSIELLRRFATEVMPSLKGA